MNIIKNVVVNVRLNNKMFRVARSEPGAPAVSTPTGTPANAGMGTVEEPPNSSGARRRLPHRGTLYAPKGADWRRA